MISLIYNHVLSFSASPSGLAYGLCVCSAIAHRIDHKGSWWGFGLFPPESVILGLRDSSSASRSNFPFSGSIIDSHCGHKNRPGAVKVTRKPIMVAHMCTIIMVKYPQRCRFFLRATLGRNRNNILYQGNVILFPNHAIGTFSSV